MELTQLQYFRTIARLENLTKASQELHVTQPNLSISIARLEESIGVPLFFRRKGQIKLNPYGQAFLEYVDNSFWELESGIKKVHELYEINQRQLSVATSINDLLPELLTPFSRQNPDIHIKQFNYSNSQIVEQLITQNIDFAITSERITHPKIDWLPVVETEKILLLNSNHRLANKKCISITELENERFICDTTRYDGKFIEQIGKKAGFVPQIVCESNDNKLAVDLLEANFGVVFVSASALLRIIEIFPEMSIKAVRIDDSLAVATIGIAKLKNHHFSKATETFYNYVLEFLSVVNIKTREFLRETDFK